MDGETRVQCSAVQCNNARAASAVLIFPRPSVIQHRLDPKKGGGGASNFNRNHSPTTNALEGAVGAAVVLEQGREEEEAAAGAQFLQLVGVGVERPQEAGSERDGGGAVGEEGGVPGMERWWGGIWGGVYVRMCWFPCPRYVCVCVCVSVVGLGGPMMGWGIWRWV